MFIFLSGNKNYFEVNLSPQVLINVDINCDCDGMQVMQWNIYVYYIGIPDETCQNYMTVNNPHGTNSEYNVCYTCDTDGSCYQVEPDEIYKVQEYCYISGVNAMKSEICLLILDFKIMIVVL